MRAQQLADKLEVSVRTIYRDIAELQNQHVPISGEAGVGYILGKGLSLPPLMLTPSEVEAAFLGAHWVAQQGEPGLSKAAQLLMDKIRAVLPNELLAIAEQPNIIAARREDAPKDQVDIAPIRTAIHQQKIVVIDYVDKQGNYSQRRIWPFLIAYFEQARIIAAWCELRNNYRHFRTDHIHHVTISDEQFLEHPQSLKEKWIAQEFQQDTVQL